MGATGSGKSELLRTL
ncbi:hypothetical protein, partial [Micromonospora sp. NPDC005174]